MYVRGIHIALFGGGGVTCTCTVATCHVHGRSPDGDYDLRRGVSLPALSSCAPDVSWCGATGTAAPGSGTREAPQ